MSSNTSNPLKIVDVTSVDHETAEEMLEAATSQGFLFIEGHDFTQEEVDMLFEVSKQFFALPDPYK